MSAGLRQLSKPLMPRSSSTQALCLKPATPAASSVGLHQRPAAWPALPSCGPRPLSRSKWALLVLLRKGEECCKPAEAASLNIATSSCARPGQPVHSEATSLNATYPSRYELKTKGLAGHPRCTPMPHMYTSAASYLYVCQDLPCFT